jgi:RNA polymerase sigma factor (sigma-70 family)
MQPPSELVAFCRSEHPRLVGLLGLYCGDRDVAEDIAQEVLVRVCREWGRVRKLDSPQAWAYRVGTNLAHSHFRRRGVERRALRRLAIRTEAEPSLSPGPESGDEIMGALAQLPHRQRTAILVRYYLDLSVRDAAEVMGCPEATVKTLTRRGLRALGEVVDVESEEVTVADVR